MNIVPLVLFVFETYHAISHYCILFRVRMLPKRDLVRVRNYFLIDLFTVLASALYTQQLWWLCLVQNLQHAYFYITWNKSDYCIRVINWSSLDFMVANSPDGKNEELKEPESRMDVSLGTAFDMLVHVVYAAILITYLNVDDIMASLVLLALLTRLVLFNPKFAWSSPKWVPEWVGKRVRPVV